MDQLISKYRQLQRVEKALHQKMLSRSNRLKAFREGESFDDESRELSLENDYERSRDHLGDLHGKLNLLKTELARRLRWKYEVMIHEIESDRSQPLPLPK